MLDEILTTPREYHNITAKMRGRSDDFVVALLESPLAAASCLRRSAGRNSRDRLGLACPGRANFRGFVTLFATLACVLVVEVVAEAEAEASCSPSGSILALLVRAD